MELWKSNLGWKHLRQMPYPLYYLAPVTHLFSMSSQLYIWAREGKAVHASALGYPFIVSSDTEVRTFCCLVHTPPLPGWRKMSPQIPCSTTEPGEQNIPWMGTCTCHMFGAMGPPNGLTSNLHHFTRSKPCPQSFDHMILAASFSAAERVIPPAKNLPKSLIIGS